MVITRLALVVAAAFALAGCPAKGPTGPGPEPTPDPTPDPLPGRHAACATGKCATGLTCVDYVGVTGQTLRSCEIPCGEDGTCAAGEKCESAADGPQNVCRVATTTTVDPPGGPEQGKPCDAGKCSQGLTCVEYYGVAGPRGPKFTSCEITCKGKTACPGTQKCTTIADGPGEVCRP